MAKGQLWETRPLEFWAKAKELRAGWQKSIESKEKVVGQGNTFDLNFDWQQAFPALTVIDAITRLLPGVLGGENSAAIESFSHGDNLEYPQYTRPEAFTTPDGQTLKVPDVLLSGHHAEIDAWRAAHATKKN